MINVVQLKQITIVIVNKNKHHFTVNSEIHHYATRWQSNFHQPAANLTKYQKGTGYLGVKVFNKLPLYIKEEFDNTKKIQTECKKLLN